MGKIQKAIAAIYAEKQEMGKIRQKDLAKALGCSQATVSHILNGSRTLSEKWIEALCEQLDISLGDIEEVKSRPPDPEELRECYVRLKRLYETRYVPGFRSVSRNIEDWLEDVPHASAGQNADSATKVVKGDFTIRNPLPWTTAIRNTNMTRRAKRSTRRYPSSTISGFPRGGRMKSLPTRG